MPREQVGYNPQVELTQVTASPNIHTVQANQNLVGSKTQQLISQLGVAFPQANKLYQQALDNETKAAEEYARSITPQDLKKQIDDGTLMPSQSPLFQATVRHTYGSNQADMVTNDVIQRATKGEFETPDQANAALTEARNKALSGQDQYVIAGFDKHYNGIQNKLQGTVLSVNNQKSVDAGETNANISLRNSIDRVRSPEFKGTVEEAATVIGDAYRMQITGNVLFNKTMRSNALRGVLTDISKNGDVNLLEQVLQQKLDHGGTITDSIGLDDAATFIMSAQRVAQSNYFLQQHQDSVSQLNSMVEESLKNNTFNGGAQFKTAKAVGKTGEPVDYNAEKYAKEILARQSASLPFEQRVSLYATRGVEDDSLSAVINTGAENIRSIGLESKDKKSGELSQNGKAAVDTFLRVQAVDRVYADSLVKGDSNKQLYRLVGIFNDMGKTPEAAATYATQAVNSNLENLKQGGKINTEVTSLVKSALNPSFFSDGPVVWGKQKWDNFKSGNDYVNYDAFAADMVDVAGALYASGQATDAPSAVEKAQEYFHQITSRVNNTGYYKRDLPHVPSPTFGTPEDFMLEFINTTIAPIAEARGFDPKEVSLRRDNRGIYTAYVAGQALEGVDGLPVQRTKQQLDDWSTNEYQRLMQVEKAGAVAKLKSKKSSFHKALNERILD